MKIKLNKGQTAFDLAISDEKVLDILIGQDAPGIGHDTVNGIIARGIADHSPSDMTSRKIALIIPDDTRLWARGDLYVLQIVKTLLALGVETDNITIIIALGTHRDMAPESFPELAGTFCARNVRIVNSANQNKDRLTHIGTTYKGTDLYITKEAADADHIIIFGGILHHMLAGFGGGENISCQEWQDMIPFNRIIPLPSGMMERPIPWCVRGNSGSNPVNEDLVDAARMVLKDKTCSYVAIAVNGTGQIFHAAVGDLDNIFMDGCRRLDEACCVSVPCKGDFAVISTGSHRTDRQLYQSTKALFNTVDIVKPGGDILFIAGCEDGAGNDEFAEVLAQYRHTPEDIGRKLAEAFSMPAYVAFRVIDILNRFNVTLYSDLDRNTATRFGFHYTEDIEQFIRGLSGKGFIIPFAENILPVVAKS